MYIDIRDKAWQEHNRDIQQELEQRHLFEQTGDYHPLVRSAAGCIGKALVSLGTRLENFEHQDTPAAIYHHSQL